ncbi:MAG TPA: hypothetical protein VGI56_01590 [Galbitalea sp.]
MNKALVSLAMAVVAVLTLVGCSPPSPTSAPSSTATAAAAATDAPTPTPTPGKPTEADLVVTPDGIAPLVVGEPIPDESADTAIAIWNPSFCVNSTAGIKPGDPTAGAWTANYPEDATGYSVSLPFSVVVPTHVKADPISQIMVSSANLSTSQGIRVGSTTAQLKAAYPSLVTGPHSTISDIYSVDGTTGTLVFEVANGLTPHYWSTKQIGAILWMRIVPLGSEIYAIAGTDGIALCDTGE